MITQIQVDGFKSLRAFKLPLNRGLNILVGPNGSGKTNIILFFEFLSLLCQEHLGTAVSSVGGAGSIFQKIGRDDYRNSIRCTIRGCAAAGKSNFFVYEYRFEVKISFERDDVYFSKQEIRIASTNEFQDEVNAFIENTRWDFEVVYKKTRAKGTQIKIGALNVEALGLKHLVFDEKQPRKIVQNFVERQNPAYFSVLRSVSAMVDNSYQIYSDLIGGETFNIIPSKVREQEDAASPPGIRKDGSGLATTLYAMKKNRGRTFARLALRYLFEPEGVYSAETLTRIIAFLRAANASIEALDVENDQFNNQLVVKISIRSGSFEAMLPLSAMSDGTVKWLALITAIFTSRTIFSIEEPENFLHPWMQAEITEIMRTHLGEKELPGFVLMTTHSESLLNSVRPDEIIIVSLTNGRTVARRVRRLSRLKEEISKTGFGLGHFYVSNTLSHD